MIQYGNDVRCACGHWWADHHSDDTCALCGCDWFQVGRVRLVAERSQQ